MFKLCYSECNQCYFNFAYDVMKVKIFYFEIIKKFVLKDANYPSISIIHIFYNSSTSLNILFTQDESNEKVDGWYQYLSELRIY